MRLQLGGQLTFEVVPLKERAQACRQSIDEPHDASLRHPHDQIDRSRQTRPLRRLLLQSPPPGAGQAVELDRAPGGQLTRRGLDPALMLQAVERWIERA